MKEPIADDSTTEGLEAEIWAFEVKMGQVGVECTNDQK